MQGNGIAAGRLGETYTDCSHRGRTAICEQLPKLDLKITPSKTLLDSHSDAKRDSRTGLRLGTDYHQKWEPRDRYSALSGVANPNRNRPVVHRGQSPVLSRSVGPMLSRSVPISNGGLDESKGEKGSLDLRAFRNKRGSRPEKRRS